MTESLMRVLSAEKQFDLHAAFSESDACDGPMYL